MPWSQKKLHEHLTTKNKTSDSVTRDKNRSQTSGWRAVKAISDGDVMTSLRQSIHSLSMFFILYTVSKRDQTNDIRLSGLST